MAGLEERFASEIRESVERGGPFLDEHYAGWRDRVDRDTVRMDDAGRCVLAQASGKSYFDAVADHHMDHQDDQAWYGLTIPSDINAVGQSILAFAFLDNEWRRQYFDN